MKPPVALQRRHGLDINATCTYVIVASYVGPTIADMFGQYVNDSKGLPTCVKRYLKGVPNKTVLLHNLKDYLNIQGPTYGMFMTHGGPDIPIPLKQKVHRINIDSDITSQIEDTEPRFLRRAKSIVLSAHVHHSDLVDPIPEDEIKTPPRSRSFGSLRHNDRLPPLLY